MRSAVPPQHVQRPPAANGAGHAFRHVMSQWPTGVAIVTSTDNGHPAGCTVQSVMSFSLAPPSLVVSLAHGSRTRDAIERSGIFAVHILEGAQQHLGERFAAGTAEQRFRDMATFPVHGVPVLRDVRSVVVCHVEATWQCADHVIVVGTPQWHSPEITDTPLIRHQSSYRVLR